MSLLLQDLTKGYRERVNRLAIFEPLFELNRKVGRDMHGNPIDWFSLGLLTLLFFFESMLTRRRQTSVSDLAEYLRTLNSNGPIYAGEEGFVKMARELVEAFRDTSGKRKVKSFFNWETGRREEIYYSLLEVRESDLSRNMQYYRLTERGLELIFATKEYFSEFHLSINQLLLRKQLEKGELKGALREIDEMRVAVEELHRKMQQLNQEVQRNIISHETQDKYLKMLADTHARLAREHEEFKELHGFVQETKKKFEYEMGDAKERQAYSLILLIARELEAVHHQHRALLDDSITLKRKAMQAAKESLYHAGLTAFNFNQDITSRCVTSPLPLVALPGLLRPFLGSYLEKGWSPLEVFAPQRLGKADEDGEWNRLTFTEADEKAEESDFFQKQRHNFQIITGWLQEIMGDREAISLSEVIAALAPNPDRQPILAERSFYDYWLILHQMSPVVRGQDTSDDRAARLLDAIINAWPEAVSRLEVTEKPELLQPCPRYWIQDMTLKIRMNQHAV